MGRLLQKNRIIIARKKNPFEDEGEPVQRELL